MRLCTTSRADTPRRLKLRKMCRGRLASPPKRAEACSATMRTRKSSRSVGGVIVTVLSTCGIDKGPLKNRRISRGRLPVVRGTVLGVIFDCGACEKHGGGWEPRAEVGLHFPMLFLDGVFVERSEAWAWHLRPGAPSARHSRGVSTRAPDLGCGFQAGQKRGFNFLARPLDRRRSPLPPRDDRLARNRLALLRFPRLLACGHLGPTAAGACVPPSWWRSRPALRRSRRCATARRRR